MCRTDSKETGFKKNNNKNRVLSVYFKTLIVNVIIIEHIIIIIIIKKGLTNVLFDAVLHWGFASKMQQFIFTFNFDSGMPCNF